MAENYKSGIKVERNVPIDLLYGPYKSIDDANSKVTPYLRSVSNVTGLKVGRTVAIDNGTTRQEYWWDNGIADTDLVLKSAGGSGSVNSVVAGIGMSIDNTDPTNPIVNASNALTPIVPASTFSPIIFPIVPTVTSPSTVSYVENIGLLTVTKDSGISLIGAVSTSEMDYIILNSSHQSPIIGIQADGQPFVVSTGASNLGKLQKINTSGTGSAWSTKLFSPATVAIPATAIKNKIEYNVSGDVTISYTTNIDKDTWIVWGTATRSDMIAAGYTVASQQMGIGVYFGSCTILEFKPKGLPIVKVGDYFVETESPYYNFINKRVTIFGDSITAESAVSQGDFIDKLKSDLKCAVLNKIAASGNAIGNSINKSMSQDINLSKCISQVPDLIIILGGVNDYIHNVTIGDYSSYAAILNTTTNPIGGSVYSTTAGMRNMILYIKNMFPESNLVVFGPEPSDIDVNPNSVGLTRKDYSACMREVCRCLNTPYNDLEALEFGPIASVTAVYKVDATHPNGGKGCARLAKTIARTVNVL